MPKRLAAILAVALFLSACAPATPPPVTPGPTVPVPPTGLSNIKHVFIVMMENHGYDSIWNSSNAPYIHSLASQYARATNYQAQAHPSLPNYLQLFAGDNYNITNDCSPSTSCSINARNLGDNLDAKGLSWKAYLESMPAPCFQKEQGNYAPRHNPLVYFDDIRTDVLRCATHDVPFSVLPVDLTTAATTPNFALVVPDLCNDMHDCSISQGDTWLKTNLPSILNSPACTSDTCLVVLTWDEAEGVSEGSANRVLTIFAGSAAQTGGLASNVAYSHYSLLRTVEAIFGLPTLTANDAAAAPMFDMLK